MKRAPKRGKWLNYSPCTNLFSSPFTISYCRTKWFINSQFQYTNKKMNNNFAFVTLLVSTKKKEKKRKENLKNWGTKISCKISEWERKTMFRISINEEIGFLNLSIIEFQDNIRSINWMSRRRNKKILNGTTFWIRQLIQSREGVHGNIIPHWVFPKSFSPLQ